MEDELSSQQVIPPILQDPHNDIELLIISGVFSLGIIEVLAKVS